MYIERVRLAYAKNQAKTCQHVFENEGSYQKLYCYYKLCIPNL